MDLAWEGMVADCSTSFVITSGWKVQSCTKIEVPRDLDLYHHTQVVDLCQRSTPLASHIWPHNKVL